jgi:hypothetical protein
MLIINFLSDHKGRKVALLIVQICGIVGTASTKSAYRKVQFSLYSYFVRWLIQAGLPAVYRTILLRVQRLLHDDPDLPLPLRVLLVGLQAAGDRRPQLRLVPRISNCRCITFSLLGILYYYYNYWRDFLLYISLVPMLITLALSWSFLV